MTAAHSVALTVGLFALTFLSPGPNLLVVVQSSLANGRRGGIAAGLGVALGDAIYAALGLLGMAALIAQSGEFFAVVKVCGGIYLLWLAWNLIARGSPHDFELIDAGAVRGKSSSLFMRGLLTDLANPQTVLFFASIFAVTLTPETPLWARLTSWLGIVLSSCLWRALLSFTFSRQRMRKLYARWQRMIEKIAGVALAGFGVRLLLEGFGRR